MPTRVGVITMHDGIQKDLAECVWRDWESVFSKDLALRKFRGERKGAVQECDSLPNHRECADVLLTVVQNISRDFLPSKLAHLKEALRIVLWKEFSAEEDLCRLCNDAVPSEAESIKDVPYIGTCFNRMRRCRMAASRSSADLFLIQIQQSHVHSRLVFPPTAGMGAVQKKRFVALLRHLSCRVSDTFEARPSYVKGTDS